MQESLPRPGTVEKEVFRFVCSRGKVNESRKVRIVRFDDLLDRFKGQLTPRVKRDGLRLNASQNSSTPLPRIDTYGHLALRCTHHLAHND